MGSFQKNLTSVNVSLLNTNDDIEFEILIDNKLKIADVFSKYKCDFSSYLMPNENDRRIRLKTGRGDFLKYLQSLDLS